MRFFQRDHCFFFYSKLGPFFFTADEIFLAGSKKKEKERIEIGLVNILKTALF